MTAYNNGGAIAIKGFNYQKSVAILLAILLYSGNTEFELYVETDDDLKVTANDVDTYIQIKDNALSLSNITLRKKTGGGQKDSILEKNLANGLPEKSRYKIVSPQFIKPEKFLSGTSANLLTGGAKVYEFNSVSKQAITKRLPNIQQDKLNRLHVAVTEFPASQETATKYLLGEMASNSLLVDGDLGRICLNQLYHLIDEKSEIIITSDDDKQMKVFNRSNLSPILLHSSKKEYYDAAIKKLDYTVAQRAELTKLRTKVGAIYGSTWAECRLIIEGLATDTAETDIVKLVSRSIDFSTVENPLMQTAIIIDALSDVIFERINS